MSFIPLYSGKGAVTDTFSVSEYCLTQQKHQVFQIRRAPCPHHTGAFPRALHILERAGYLRDYQK